MLPIDPWLIWLIIAIVMLVVEFITVGFFTITIACGALVAMLISFVIPYIWIQVAVFLVSSVICFYTVKPFLLSLFPVQNETRTAVDRLTGKICVVIVDIDNVNGTGQIKVDGDVWSARSSLVELIEAGTTVKIISVEGVKAIVTKIE